MLYICFRVAVMFAAIMGVLHMISEENYLYILFPLAIIIWAIYTFFDENDREYLRRNGIDPDEVSWFFPDYSDYGAVKSTNYSTYYPRNNYRRTYPSRTEDYSRYAPSNQYQGYNNTEYKKLKDKCKRNFKITISKEETNDENLLH